MDYPVVIENVLSEKIFLNLNNYIKNDWILNNASNENDKFSWGKEENNFLIYYEVATIIKLKIKKHIKNDLIFIGSHINGQTSYQTAQFHIDYRENDVWSFVLFTNTFWDTNWGGEFIVYNMNTCKYNYVPYIPNTGVLFPSNWSHVGSSPNSSTDQLRTSIGFRFCDRAIYETMKKYVNVAKSIYS